MALNNDATHGLKVALTGSTGYIGSKLATHLCQKGYDVVALIRTRNTTLPDGVIQISCSGPEAFADALPEDTTAVFHLAAAANKETSLTHVREIVEANIQMPTMLLHTMHARGIRNFINVGTYWQSSGTDMPWGNSLYAASKSALTPILDYYCSRLGLHATTLRLPDVYGEDDSRPKLLNQLREHEAGTVFDLTEGNQTLYPLHVDDVIDALIAAFQLTVDSSAPGHAQYSVFGESVSLRDMVEAFCETLNLKVELGWGARPYPDGQIFEPDNLPVLPGWEPNITLKEGFRRFRT